MSRVVYAWIGQDYRGNILVLHGDSDARALWRKKIPLSEMDQRVLETVAREPGTQIYYRSPTAGVLGRALVVIERGEGISPEAGGPVQV